MVMLREMDGSPEAWKRNSTPRGPDASSRAHAYAEQVEFAGEALDFGCGAASALAGRLREPVAGLGSC